MPRAASPRYAINWEAENAKKADEIRLLRAALRKYAIKRHVRLSEGLRDIPNGGSCALCGNEWSNGWPEGHDAYCLLARGR
jgi:hypothetical protein